MLAIIGKKSKGLKNQSSKKKGLHFVSLFCLTQFKKMMNIEVLRFSSQSQTTLSAILIDGKFECYGLEDCHREKKVKGETRIPAGKYAITIRTEGGFHYRYQEKFPLFHEGMLWVRDVEGFEFILIHIGNTKKDTEGCLLVGEGLNNNKMGKGMVSNSTGAYTALYKKVVSSAVIGELTIEYKDLDKPYKH